MVRVVLYKRKDSMRIEEKLTLLADAAKYDASCASSGSRRINSGRLLGNAAASGICHTYTEDGRCVSLLKILFTNVCIYDCLYCINRSGNDIPRAMFTVGEVVALTIDFYRRNYIEGLFLSSGILKSPDDTMEQLIRVVRRLREDGFNGYIHLKCVPHASRELIREAGRHADRLSINIELPSEDSLKRLTSDKTYASVLDPMGVIREAIAEALDGRRRSRHAPAFAPAGQSTQLIIGASPESDHDILSLADRLYREQTLKRVYYSAYVPVQLPGTGLPDVSDPPLGRENRLYQADWLMRLYGYSIEEIVDTRTPYLDLAIDPKQSFASRHPEQFPIDINTAEREWLLRVPGIGLTSANRIASLRLRGRIRFEHLKQLGVVVKRAQPYIRCDGMTGGQWLGQSYPATTEATSVDRNREGSANTSILKPHRVFVTDGSFEGLLTAIFESYSKKGPPHIIEPDSDVQTHLFDCRVRISTDAGKSDRVWAGLKKRLGAGPRQRLFEAYLSGSPGVETMIYRLVREALPSRNDPGFKADLSCRIEVQKLSGKVRREAHRMKGFCRFQDTGGERYLAVIAPRYDVLPLIRRHFESRFADQQWIIYDAKRHYGICYDRQTSREVTLDTDEVAAAQSNDTPGEQICQTLWRRYYEAATVPQRRNPKQHLGKLPRRYWRYLTEKSGEDSGNAALSSPATANPHGDAPK